MWNSDHWKQFLSKCRDYPEEDIIYDARMLTRQDLSPSTFKSLIDIYERDFSAFKHYFPTLTLGNLLRFVDGLKSYVAKGISRPGNELKILEHTPELVADPECSGGPPAKRFRADQNAPDIQWFENVKKYMLYFVREGNRENSPRLCAWAISPTMAVTFAHGKNKCFAARLTYQGRMIERGTILTLYSPYNGHEQQEIKSEVVSVNEFVDYVLIEALDGRTFYDGNEDETILEEPFVGGKFLAVGSSSDSPPQEAIKTGDFIGGFDEYEVYADITGWKGCPGGGLFSISNKLLGVVSTFEESDEGPRTRFVPGNMLRDVWEEYRIASGKKEHSPALVADAAECSRGPPAKRRRARHWPPRRISSLMFD